MFLPVLYAPGYMHKEAYSNIVHNKKKTYIYIYKLENRPIINGISNLLLPNMVE